MTKTDATQHLRKESLRAKAAARHEALPPEALARAKKGSNPRSQIKTVYWRGDVITLVNKLFGYELVQREPRPDQAWFWTDSWQRAIDASVESLESGRGTVYANEADFLASLDE